MKKLILLVTSLIVIPVAVVFAYNEVHGRTRAPRRVATYHAPAPNSLEARIDRFQWSMHDRLIALNTRLDNLLVEVRTNGSDATPVKDGGGEGMTLEDRIRRLDDRVWMARWDLLQLDSSTAASWQYDASLTKKYIDGLERKADVLVADVRDGLSASARLGEVEPLMKLQRGPNGLVLVADPDPVPLRGGSVAAGRDNGREAGATDDDHAEAARRAAPMIADATPDVANDAFRAVEAAAVGESTNPASDTDLGPVAPEPESIATADVTPRFEREVGSEKEIAAETDDRPDAKIEIVAPPLVLTGAAAAETEPAPDAPGTGIEATLLSPHPLDLAIAHDPNDPGRDHQ